MTYGVLQNNIQEWYTIELFSFNLKLKEKIDYTHLLQFLHLQYSYLNHVFFPGGFIFQIRKQKKNR